MKYKFLDREDIVLFNSFIGGIKSFNHFNKGKVPITSVQDLLNAYHKYKKGKKYEGLVFKYFSEIIRILKPLIPKTRSLS